MGRFVPFLSRWSVFAALFVYSSSILDSVKAGILAVWAAINVTRIRWRLEDLCFRRELLSESKIPPDSGVPDERRFFQNGGTGQRQKIQLTPDGLQAIAYLVGQTYQQFANVTSFRKIFILL